MGFLQTFIMQRRDDSLVKGDRPGHKYISKRPDGKGSWIYKYKNPETGETYEHGEAPVRDLKQWHATLRGARSRHVSGRSGPMSPQEQKRLEHIDAQIAHVKKLLAAGHTHASDTSVDGEGKEKPAPTPPEKPKEPPLVLPAFVSDADKLEAEIKRLHADGFTREEAIKRIAQQKADKLAESKSADRANAESAYEKVHKEAIEATKTAEASQHTYDTRAAFHDEAVKKRLEAAKAATALGKDGLAEVHRAAATSHQMKAENIRKQKEHEETAAISRLAHEGNETFRSRAAKLHEKGITSKDLAEVRAAAKEMRDTAVAANARANAFGNYSPEGRKWQEHASAMWRHERTLSEHAKKLETIERRSKTIATKKQREQATATAMDSDHKPGEAKGKEFYLATVDGPKKHTAAAIHGDYAVHAHVDDPENKHGYQVTHIPTGMSVSNSINAKLSKEKATSLARHMHEHAPGVMGKTFGKPLPAPGDVEKLKTGISKWGAATYGSGSKNAPKLPEPKAYNVKDTMKAAGEETSRAVREGTPAAHTKAAEAHRRAISELEEMQKKTGYQSPYNEWATSHKRSAEQHDAWAKMAEKKAGEKKRPDLAGTIKQSIDKQNDDTKAQRFASGNYLKDIRSGASSDKQDAEIEADDEEDGEHRAREEHEAKKKRDAQYLANLNKPGYHAVNLEGSKAPKGRDIETYWPDDAERSMRVIEDQDGRRHYITERAGGNGGDVKRHDNKDDAIREVERSIRKSANRNLRRRAMDAERGEMIMHKGEDGFDMLMKAAGVETPQPVRRAAPRRAEAHPIAVEEYDASIRAQFRMDGREPMQKGLYKFAPSGSGSMGSVPDEYLVAYLDAFIEEAYEHERNESAHKNPSAHTVGGDVAAYYAKFVFNELVTYIPCNSNLKRAVTKLKVTESYIAERLRALGSVNPMSTTGPDHGDFMQGFQQSEGELSLMSTAIDSYSPFAKSHASQRSIDAINAAARGGEAEEEQYAYQRATLSKSNDDVHLEGEAFNPQFHRVPNIYADSELRVSDDPADGMFDGGGFKG